MMNHVTLKEHELPEEDALRANLYGFLARLLLAPPTSEILKETAELKGILIELINKAHRNAIVTAKKDVNLMVSDVRSDNQFNSLSPAKDGSAVA